MLTNDAIHTVCGPKTNKRFDDLNPTYIGTTGGVRFFEHPLKGDEAPLIAKHNGGWVLTCFWEVPDIFELAA